jgi:hypothetical protein
VDIAVFDVRGVDFITPRLVQASTTKLPAKQDQADPTQPTSAYFCYQPTLYMV